MHTIPPRLLLPFLLMTVGARPLFAAAQATLDVAVDRPGIQVSPMLWGIFFEDINLSADGGIYPVLVRTRSFEDAETAEHWQLDQP